MNKLNIKAYMLLLWAVFSISGCSGSRDHAQMYLEAKTQDEPGEQIKEDKKEKPDTILDLDGKSAVDDTEMIEQAQIDTCFVYVCGAVKHPGVFELPLGSRVYEAIALAGGFCEDAYKKGMNQAEQIQDGDMIEVLTIEEQKELERNSENRAEKEAYKNGNDFGHSMDSEDPDLADGLIDINTASAAQLMTLNGIGEAKAANIIAYRESNGGFSAAEEIMNVSGIGEGVYAKIQDKIKVTNTASH